MPPVFLGVFTGLLVLGAGIALIPGIDVIQPLIVTQVVNGLLLPIELVTMVRLINDRVIMGAHANGLLRNLLAYGTVGAVSILSMAYLAVTVLGLFGISTVAEHVDVSKLAARAPQLRWVEGLHPHNHAAAAMHGGQRCSREAPRTTYTTASNQHRSSSFFCIYPPAAPSAACICMPGSVRAGWRGMPRQPPRSIVS